METFMATWANDEGPRDAFSSDFEPQFDIPVPQNEIFLSLVNCPAVIQNHAKPIIKSLSKGFLEVLNLQLKDFLPHGKYHDVVDADLCGRLSHSKLTNITGEQCFGDLDFSLFKRRNASMHHLSTLNMLNRNRTVSSFLASLTAEEEQRVFKLSSKKAASIRKLHTEQEQQAIQRKCQHLEEVKQRKAAMEEKKRARKEAIFDKIRLHGGPCKTTEDVNRLLSHYRKKTDRVHAVRAEIHFHKYIMDRKSPLLKVTAKFPEQLANLKQFLQNLGPTAPQEEVPDRREPVRDLREEAEAVQEVQTHDEGQHDFNFMFSNAGVPVAVFYDNDHYLGEVTTVHTQELASVSFMQRCLIRSDAYRWPHTPDETEVNARYVFSANFGLSSTNGRVWILQEPEALLEWLSRFKELLLLLVLQLLPSPPPSCF